MAFPLLVATTNLFYNSCVCVLSECLISVEPKLISVRLNFGEKFSYTTSRYYIL